MKVIKGYTKLLTEYTQYLKPGKNHLKKMRSIIKGATSEKTANENLREYIKKHSILNP
jgi:hypothetical protein